MKKTLLICLFSILTMVSQAATLKGIVEDEKGEGLPFASIYIKGTTRGTTTNVEGKYSLDMAPGSYTMVCQYVGYQKAEHQVTLSNETQTLNITLQPSGASLKEVVVKSGGEDPAYAIVRKAIKKRPEYNKEIDFFKANVYNKGVIKLDETSDSKFLLGLMGGGGKDNKEKTQKELEEQKGIIHLSEAFSEVMYKRPDKLKVNVKSSKLSGKSNGYGFSDPIFVNFYDNNVSLGDQMSPRGFVSPIADNALLSYRYELLGAYVEDGKLVNKIKVMPRRKFEPLFSGIIHIIENEWRLHSVDVYADKDHQLELLDTVNIRQIFVPVNNMLMVKDQHFKLKMKLMGFGFTGNFINVYTDYDFKSELKFDKFAKEYNADALKKNKEYWDENRPIPLDADEIKDYVKKDSIEKAEKFTKDTTSTKYNTFRSVIFQGYRVRTNTKTSLRTMPLVSLKNFNWNTVEGFNYTFGATYRVTPDEDHSFSAKLRTRYGVSNQQFNAKLAMVYKTGKTNRTTLSAAGGRYVFQYNNQEPVNPLLNSCYDLFYGQNYLKLYQAWFAQIGVQYELFNGLGFNAKISWQDRQPIGNSNYFSFVKNTHFTPNFPVELRNTYEPQHQALLARIGLSYQPGRKYIKYPDRIKSLGSKYPVFEASYTRGLQLLNSDVDYSVWDATMHDDMKLNLWGTLQYRLTIGGFLHDNMSYTADYTHFNGNQMLLASDYVNSFQLASYYANSNTEAFYFKGHAEHHFYGLLTNKIPLFRKLKWYLVAGSNTYYVQRDNNYIEAFAGLENIGWGIGRFIRVDLIAGYSNLQQPVYGVRVGINSNFISLGDNDPD
jgi:hypothetical protein